MILRHLIRLVLPALAILATSCTGYHLGASKPAQMREVHTVAVPNVKNLTLQPRIDVEGQREVMVERRAQFGVRADQAAERRRTLLRPAQGHRNRF